MRQSPDHPAPVYSPKSDQQQNNTMPDLTTVAFNTTSHNSTQPYDMSCTINNDPWDIMTSHNIYLYSSMAFMVLGLTGNILSMMVFSAPEMRVISSNVYLLVLAVSDSTYLISVFFGKNLSIIKCFFFPDNNIDIYNQSAFFCKFLQYMQDLFSSYSPCVIMAFTIERYVAVYLPIRFKNTCTVVRARLVCLAIFVVISIFILPYHILYMHHYEFYNICSILVSHEQTFSILYTTEAFVFRVVPVIVVAVLNVCIIVRVRQVTKHTRQRQSNSHANGNKRSKRPKEDRSSQLTIMLILVSTSYILTYIPVLVHFVLWKLQRSQLIHINSHTMLTTKNYAAALYIAGFGINFFLYTVSGRMFREQLCMVVKRSEVRRPKQIKSGVITGMPITAASDV